MYQLELRVEPSVVAKHVTCFAPCKALPAGRYPNDGRHGLLTMFFRRLFRTRRNYGKLVVALRPTPVRDVFPDHVVQLVPHRNWIHIRMSDGTRFRICAVGFEHIFGGPCPRTKQHFEVKARWASVRLTPVNTN